MTHHQVLVGSLFLGQGSYTLPLTHGRLQSYNLTLNKFPVPQTIKYSPPQVASSILKVTRIVFSLSQTNIADQKCLGLTQQDLSLTSTAPA